jgi:WD40 repeat protein
MLQGWHGLAFFPDSKRLVFVNEHRKAEVWDVEKKAHEFYLGGERGFQAPHLALSQDGRWFAGLAQSDAAAVWDTQRRKELAAFRPERAAIWALAWNRDASLLALGLSDGGLVVWDLKAVRTELADLGLWPKSNATSD